MKDLLGRMLAAWRVRAVLPHIEGRLLDIGCGVNRLVRAYGNGIGVDVFPWEGADLIVDDSSALPFESQSFQTVTFLACLNHIPNRLEALREARRVLKPGGKIIVTMIPPALSRIWHRVRRPWEADQRERGMRDGEVYGLGKAEVRRLIERGGFAVERQFPFMLFLNNVTIGRTANP